MDDNLAASRQLFENDPVLQAAWLYYHEDLSQSEVASIMGISRVTIVKYLQMARENGVVHINLDLQRYANIEKALTIKDYYGLDNVLIVPDDKDKYNQQDNIRNREKIAQAGGCYLNQIIEDNDVLGVAWGRTIHTMAQKLNPRTVKNMTVLQMLGSVPSQSDFTTIESASLIANKFSGQCVYLHVPAVVSHAALAKALKDEPIIQRNFSALQRCTKALFVVGNASDENPLIRADVITQPQMAEYRNMGAVGVICGRFYNSEGRPVYAPVDEQILGIELSQLRKIKRRIFLAGGADNFTATLGAIKGGYVSDLIIDESNAKFLLQQIHSD